MLSRRVFRGLRALVSAVVCGAMLVSGSGRDCTLTSYNVMSGSGSSGPGSLAQWKVSRKFTRSVNIAAVHERLDWPRLKYHTVRISFRGKSAEFEIFDTCADRNCGGCCTKNRKAGGRGMLFDLDSSAVQRIWGIRNAENSLFAAAKYTVGKRFDPKWAAKTYGASWDG